MADPNSVYESTVFVDTFPWGGSDANQIDDFMRYILSAIKGRMADEHYWFWTAEPDYLLEQEGRHTPEASRIWAIATKKNGTSVEYVPELPAELLDATLRPAMNGSLLVAEEVGDNTQLDGTFWYLNGDRLHTISRLRGQVNLNGRIRFAAIDTKIHDVSIEGAITLDEGHGTRTTAEPRPASDGIELRPYLHEEGYEKDAHEEAGPMDVLVYPIRAGAFDSAGIYTEPEDNTQGFGVAIDVGNLDTNGVRFVISPYGIQVRATGEYNEEDHPILFNGINVRKHNHSGELYMGESVDFASFGELTWKFVGTVHSAALSGLDTLDLRELNMGEDPANYHPPLESEGATEWTKYTRLYMWEMGASVNSNGGDFMSLRFARVAVTRDMSVTPIDGSQLPIGTLAGGYVGAAVGSCYPTQTIMLWQFPGDNQVLPETRLRLWAGSCHNGGNVDMNIVHRMRVLAWKA